MKSPMTKTATQTIDERRMDGKRFVASVYVKDNMYKDFFEDDKLNPVQIEAENKYKEVGQPCLIFDRLECMIIQKVGEFKGNKTEDKKEETIPVKKTRKKREQ